MLPAKYRQDLRQISMQNYSLGHGMCQAATASCVFSMTCRRRARSCAPSLPAITWEFPNLVVSNLAVCNFYAEALFCALLQTRVCALLRPFALSCTLLQTCVCALLCAIACFCVRPRLQQPRLGTPELSLTLHICVCPTDLASQCISLSRQIFML